MTAIFLGVCAATLTHAALPSDDPRFSGGCGDE